MGERSARNRASPFFALNAVRTEASVDAVVKSVSCARAVVWPAEPVFTAFGGWSVDVFFESHPRSEEATARTRAV